MKNRGCVRFPIRPQFFGGRRFIVTSAKKVRAAALRTDFLLEGRSAFTPEREFRAIADSPLKFVSAPEHERQKRPSTVRRLKG